MKQSCASCKHAFFKGNEHYGQCTIHWCLDGSAHPMISKNWTCGSDCKDYYCYEKLAAMISDHAAEVARLTGERDDLEQRLDIAEHDSKKAWSALDLIAWHIHRRPAGECGHSELPQMVYDLMQERDAAVAAKERAEEVAVTVCNIVDKLKMKFAIQRNVNFTGGAVVQEFAAAKEELVAALAAAQDAKPRALEPEQGGPDCTTCQHDSNTCDRAECPQWGGPEGEDA